MFTPVDAWGLRDHHHAPPYRVCWARMSCNTGPALGKHWFNVLRLPEELPVG